MDKKINVLTIFLELTCFYNSSNSGVTVFQDKHFLQFKRC